MIGQINRSCIRCGADEWYLRADGNHHCAPCSRVGARIRQHRGEYGKLYARKRRLDPVYRSRTREYQKEYERRPERMAARRARDRARWKSNPALRAAAKRRNTEYREAHFRQFAEHGLTIDQYHAMFEAQGERCRICRQALERTPCIDHDHRTNRVRGLLCHNCNRALGFFGDDVTIVAAAASYLGEFARTFG